jgi:Spy/CpxP family protein refolding chaperone
MMRLRRASVIAAPSLLAWAATASAECAWVLWANVEVSEQGGPYQGGRWDLISAYANTKQCIAWIDGKQRKTDRRQSPMAMDRYVQDPTDKTRLTHVQWRCVPDTVDPRGPKGK